jgi:hypothetical protein
MTIRPQPEPHLDADQLTAFAEGALTASERTLCLQHLAECAHCREVAFLAGASMPSEQPAPAPAHQFPFTWWSVLSLGAATIAAVAITAVLLHHTHQSTPAAAVQIATDSLTSSSPPAMTAAPMDHAVPAEPRAYSSPKPSPAQRAPRPEASDQHSQQVNGALALDSTAALTQPGALPPSTPSSKASQGISIASAGPLAQSQARGTEAGHAASDLALRSYGAAPRPLAPDGSAEISGTITDSSGATIPHAKVTLDQAAGNFHRETLTDGAGRFTIGSLQPGKYRLEISSPGFMAQVRDVELGTTQLARVDSKLTVSSVSETVAVQSGAAVMNTESAAIGSTLPDKESPQSSVSSGARTLAIDSAGKLFLSKKAGKHWKAVRGPWKKSTVTNLSLTPDQNFKVTTVQGSWLSGDGEHWHPTN